MNLLYENNTYDITILCGDINSRINNHNDFIENVDELPQRIAIDETISNHGHSFIDFLLEGRLAVVNGRICPLNDNFTCILTHGKSVVDYFVVAQENLANVTDFKL